MNQKDRVYLEPIMDLFSEEILAFNISEHPTVEFAVKALDSIPEINYRTIVYTDQGFQYQNNSWQRTSCFSKYVHKSDMF